MRTILSTTDRSLVESVRLALEGEGIAAIVQNEAGSTIPFIPVTVLVQDADYDRARSVTQELAPMTPPHAREAPMILGLRTVIYHVPDLQRAKAWYSTAFGMQPYFDEPFYVGFNVGGYELGLDPSAQEAPPGPGGAVAYWGVRDVDAAVQHFTRTGASLEAPVQDVGGDIRVATLADPFGNLIGLIENPHFAAL